MKSDAENSNNTVGAPLLLPPYELHSQSCTLVFEGWPWVWPFAPLVMAISVIIYGVNCYNSYQMSVNINVHSIIIVFKAGCYGLR